MEENEESDDVIAIDEDSNEKPDAFDHIGGRQFYDDEAEEGEPESPSTESEPPGEDLNARDDVMEDDSILDHYDESFINDANATEQNQTYDVTWYSRG